MKLKKLTALLVMVLFLMMPGLASAGAGETIVHHAAGDVTNTLTMPGRHMSLIPRRPRWGGRSQ